MGCRLNRHKRHIRRELIGWELMGCRHNRHIRPNRRELIGCRHIRHKRPNRRELMGESLLAGSLMGYDIIAFTRK